MTLITTLLLLATSASSTAGFTVPAAAAATTASALYQQQQHTSLFAATIISPSQQNDEPQTPLDQVEEESLLAMIGERENDLFDCDASVTYWKEFESLGNEKNLKRMREILSRHQLLPSLVNKNNDASRNNSEQQSLSRAYWGSHVLRSGYFTVNAFLGSVASDLHERLLSAKNNNNQEISSSNNSGGMITRLLDSDIPSRLLLETLLTYEQDYHWIASGLLQYPWDAVVQHDAGTNAKSNRLQLNHRQTNPLFILSETTKAIRESVAIFSRRNSNDKGDNNSKALLWQGKSSAIYPSYYLNDFHFQTDGWLSTTSAERYETSTETLFLGRQDAMQRQSLIPLLKQTSAPPPSSILEVACGTGRFATFVRDNFPDANLTLTDLSPYYLEKARANDQYWRSFRTTHMKKPAADTTSFVQANAEELPFPNNTFDAVLCVYLFHELPSEARKRAAAEMVRVVKPGGTIVLTDCMQQGDRSQLASIANFVKINEPHHPNYVKEGYLPELFAGCECGEKFMVSSTKTVSFTKKREE
mmetsp:Transcript_14394/g.23769  ORF Transcript_14394/g.23769 Transcript_14394/m.23769 type:complete len:531 (+) Transcript_14394:51-1643(+)|eukprot:CAMPEP_0119013582 /NCGR_PEP_ID=MMETSP1176-20130426/8525_1 /TAXON_ID=265551 /ORGANISM="Synedropsis recta cf, Strain CCMP1620" /LENGTH=530 /DNA_ID=CAMNT_0006966683 /DNA_START=25 /DNA_END=1617 /DNA_ORIENTATION=-